MQVNRMGRWSAGVVTVMFATAALVGCSGGGSGEAEETVEQASEAAPQAPAPEVKTRKDARERVRPPGPADGKPDRAPRGGGPETLFHAALHEDLALTDAQRSTIETAKASQRGPGKDDGPREDHAQRSAALASAIRAGSIDVAALKPKDDAEATQAARIARSDAALRTLHTTLSPEQRSKLVAAVKSRMPQAGNHPKRGRGDAKRRDDERSPVDALLRGVTLKAGQRDRIIAALDASGIDTRSQRPSQADMDAQHEARRSAELAHLDAFAKPSFDPATARPPKMAKPDRDAPPLVESLAVIVPLLDADQREALAVQIESGRKDGRRVRGGRGPGDRGPGGKGRRGGAAPGQSL